MSIQANCVRCGASFKAKDECAGRRCRCPKCQAVIEIPESGGHPDGQPIVQSSAPFIACPTGSSLGQQPTRPSARWPVGANRPSPSPPPPTPREILGAFRSAIEPVELSVAYQASLLLVLVVMVILPLTYVALIGLVFGLMVYHAVYDVTVFEVVHGGWSALFAAVLYLGPLVAGAICVVFMIKPLFARMPERGRTRSLTTKSDPLLFAFVARVCEAVGAPEPKQIRVDCDVNALAGFRRGLRSMVLSDDLVLTIGLPLVAGLDLRQFAGVLAHEFGHFTQGTAMRLSYLIRSISFWFTRVVYQRDQWDIWLETKARKSHFLVAWVFHFARLCVWLSRRILWVMMMTGHIVGGFLLRQMEYDADRHRVRLAGSDAFSETTQRIAMVLVAAQKARAELHEFYREGRLGDNLSRLIAANLDQMPPEVIEAIERHQREAKAGWFDTHPANKDRIANAEQEEAPGVFHVKCPASVLFSDFEGLSRNVTWDFYRGLFGPRFKPTDMHPIDDLLARQGIQREADKSLRRYFLGEFRAIRPVPLPTNYLAAPDDAQETLARLKEARQRMLREKPAYANAAATFLQSDGHMVEAAQASALLVAGLGTRGVEFSVPLADRASVREVVAGARARQREVTGQLESFERAAGTRLLAGLQLLHVPKIAARLPEADKLRKRAGRLVESLCHINRQHRSLIELRIMHAVLCVLLSRRHGNEHNPSLISSIGKQMDAVGHRVHELYEPLAKHRYPFDHAKGKISIGDSIVHRVPPRGDLTTIHAASEALVDQVPALYARIAAQLAVIAEMVEKVVGLPPLPEPDAEKQPAAQAQ